MLDPIRTSWLHAALAFLLPAVVRGQSDSEPPGRYVRENLQLRTIAHHLGDTGQHLRAARLFADLSEHGVRPLNFALNALNYYDKAGLLDAATVERVLTPLLRFELTDGDRPLLDLEFLAGYQDHPTLVAVVASIRERRERRRVSDDFTIHTDDIGRFWQAFDAACETGSFFERVDAFDRLYFEPGSKGLIDFAYLKLKSVEDFTDFVYESLRPLAGSYEPAARLARRGFDNLRKLYPDLFVPDIYLVFGRHTSFGTVGEAGLLIGAENVIAADTPVESLPPRRQRFVADGSALPFILVHESIHANQSLGGDWRLMAGVVIEGGADFLAELALGPDVYTPPYREFGRRNAARIRREFLRERESTDWSRWIAVPQEHLSKDWVGDLGYDLGHRISAAYYEKAADKTQAIRDLLEMRDVEAIIRESGYFGSDWGKR